MADGQAPAGFFTPSLSEEMAAKLVTQSSQITLT